MAQKFIMNTDTKPATFTTKNITIKIDKNNISKFFDVDYGEAFYHTTHTNGFAIQADEADGTLVLKSKYDFSNISFKYDYVDCGGSNSSIKVLYNNGDTTTTKVNVSADKTAASLSYDTFSKGHALKFNYAECDCKHRSKITLYNIEIKLSIFDILASSKIDSDLEVALNSNAEKIAFSNLSGLKTVAL